jgi:hypothetical protein
MALILAAHAGNASTAAAGKSIARSSIVADVLG